MPLVRILTFLMLLAAGSAVFAEHAVVILIAESRPGGREFAGALKERLAGIGVTAVREAATVEQAVDAKVRLVVAIGGTSYGLLRETPRSVPVLVTMMTRRGFEQMTGGGTGNASALHLDQPESRFIDLVSLLPGSPATVGVLQSSSSGISLQRLRAAVQRDKLRLIEGGVETERDISDVLLTVAGQSDVLLATPDPLVYSPQSIQAILLATFRLRVPLIGFSPAYTRAGALVSIHSSTAQLAGQAAEMIRQTLERGKLPPPQAPNDFEVSVNRNVARSLGIEMPDESWLREQIRLRERAR